MTLNQKWIAPTMDHLPFSIISFLLPFSILFRMKKSFIKMLLFFVGSLFCRGGITVCGCLRVLGLKGETAFSNYHHLLNRCKFDLLQGSKILIQMILPLINSKIVLVVDEHLERRRGEKIKAKAIYRDPVASSKKWLVKCFGLKWTVLSILVRFPWSKRSFALPIMCVLRYPEDHPKNLKRKTRSGTDITCQMLYQIRRWFPNVSITVIGDGDYARVNLCNTCKRLSIGLITRMRSDARLYYYPEANLQKKKGPLNKKGQRINRPSDSMWEKMTVNWYGGQVKELSTAVITCLWIAGKKAQIIPLKAVWVKMRPTDELILMCTEDMQVVDIIESYVKRWNLEVTFRECREYLGVETQRQWSELAIARTTPLLFALYTLVVLMGNAIYHKKGILPESTAWYIKSHLTFSDLLEAVRRELGDLTNIVNSILKTEFTEYTDSPTEESQFTDFPLAS